MEANARCGIQQVEQGKLAEGQRGELLREAEVRREACAGREAGSTTALSFSIGRPVIRALRGWRM
jgi:hypothetical protein